MVPSDPMKHMFVGVGRADNGIESDVSKPFKSFKSVTLESDQKHTILLVPIAVYNLDYESKCTIPLFPIIFCHVYVALSI